MPLYDINFTGFSVVNADTVEDAKSSFEDMMIEDHPEIEVDRIIDIVEVKV